MDKSSPTGGSKEKRMTVLFGKGDDKMQTDKQKWKTGIEEIKDGRGFDVAYGINFTMKTGLFIFSRVQSRRKHI